MSAEATRSPGGSPEDRGVATRSPPRRGRGRPVRPAARSRPAGGGLLSVLLFAAVLLGATAPAAPAQEKEKKVKAALIYQFIRFTQWPDAAFADEAAPIVVATLYDNPMGKHLDVLQQKKVRGRAIRILHCDDPAKARKAQVVFIGGSSERNIRQAISTLGSLPVLTIGSHSRFLDFGGSVKLLTLQKKIGFEINTWPLGQAALQISSKVLKLAHRVEKHRPGSPRAENRDGG